MSGKCICFEVYLIWYLDNHSCFTPAFYFFYYFKKIFLKLIYLWLCWVFVAAWGLFSSCNEQGLLFVTVHGLLTAVVSLVVEHVLLLFKKWIFAWYNVFHAFIFSLPISLNLKYISCRQRIIWSSFLIPFASLLTSIGVHLHH